MIYKRVSRGELLKALQDHARLISSDDGGEIEWKKDLDCYCMSLHGTRIFIDKFEENKSPGGMITLFRIIKVTAFDLSFDVMLGVIEASDWMVELPEEGEE